MKSWNWRNCKTCFARFCRIEGDETLDETKCKECQLQHTDAVSSVKLGDYYGKATAARNI